jgi:hypothetical protein
MDANPSYSGKEVLAKIKIPERTFYRFKAQIWKEDEPKRGQEMQDYIKRRLLVFRNPII